MANHKAMIEVIKLALNAATQRGGIRTVEEMMDRGCKEHGYGFFIIGGHKRYADLLDTLASFMRTATNNARSEMIEAQRGAGLPVDEEGNDLREWCGNDIEAAHAEALALNTPTPPAAPALRIVQESNDKEFKRDGVHCCTDCGYNCKESVRLEMIAHYEKVAAANGLAAEGWHLEVWHNGGWHACFKHAASGFMLADNLIDGGIERVRFDRLTDLKRRFSCYNYSTPEGTAQIWVYAATPWQAIGAAIREAQQRIIGYRGIIGALAPQQCDHARAADLYGATPAHSYEVKA